MTHTSAATTGQHELLPQIEGQECNYCEDGKLTRGEHKGRTAVVCPECETPQITFS